MLHIKMIFCSHFVQTLTFDGSCNTTKFLVAETLKCVDMMLSNIIHRAWKIGYLDLSQKEPKSWESMSKLDLSGGLAFRMRPVLLAAIAPTL